MKQRWFISSPARREDTTLTFFRALEAFDEAATNIEMVWPKVDMDIAARKTELDTSQVVVIEVSVPSISSGIDVGFAYATRIPIIAFHQGVGVVSPVIQQVATSVNIYLTDEHIFKVLQTLA